MRVLLDTNVVLDLFLEREPFVDDAALIWKVIITRNVDDFSKAQLPVLLPADFIQAHHNIFEKLALDSNDDG